MLLREEGDILNNVYLKLVTNVSKATFYENTIYITPTSNCTYTSEIIIFAN